MDIQQEVEFVLIIGNFEMFSIIVKIQLKVSHFKISISQESCRTYLLHYTF